MFNDSIKINQFKCRLQSVFLSKMIASSTLLDNTLTVKLYVSAQDILRETVKTLQQEKILQI